MSGHSYTAEQIAYLRRHATIERYWLTRSFNNHFGLAVTEDAIKQVCLRRGIKTGRTGRFAKGNNPFNKGKKGHNGFSCTRFKEGNRPHTWKPVDSEVVDNKDGYVHIKTAEPNVWRAKQVVLWEQANGPVPDGSCVIFADGDKLNFTPDNLVTVTRAELLYLNRKTLIKEDKDLTKTAVNVARLACRVQKLNRVRE